MKISELQPDHDLYLSCNNPRGCHHGITFTKDEALDMFGDLELDALRKRCRCQVCGYLGAKTTVIPMGDTSGDRYHRRLD